MIAPAKESSSEHRTGKRLPQRLESGRGIPDRVRLSTRFLRPGLVRYLRGEDVLARRTCLVFEDLQELAWDSVCQLFAWAVAKAERGGVLRLEFESADGWRCAQDAGLHQANGGIELVRRVTSRFASGPLQNGTPPSDPEGD